MHVDITAFKLKKKMHALSNLMDMKVAIITDELKELRGNARSASFKLDSDKTNSEEELAAAKEAIKAFETDLMKHCALPENVAISETINHRTYMDVLENKSLDSDDPMYVAWYNMWREVACVRDAFDQYS